MSATRPIRIAGWLLGILASILLVVGFFPWGSLHGIVQSRVSERLGRSVTIGAMERADTFGFHPSVAIRDLRVPQAARAGSGDLARVRTVTVTFAVWPLLTGRFQPEGIVADGVRLALVRDANGRTNWSEDRDGDGKGGRKDLTDLTICDALVSYADAKRDRQVTLRLSADPVNGVRGAGAGTVRGAPVRVALVGPAVGAGPWPFRVRIDGGALAMRAAGTMDRALDTGAMTLDVTARAADLKYIDAVIEAGLFETQPVTMRAHVRHDDDIWTITGLRGTIGRSDLAGRLTVAKVDGRSKIDGVLDSRRFAFDDLSSDRGRAAG
ncbi:MAG: AsmA family protein, partial [Sphingomonas sp.]